MPLVLRNRWDINKNIVAGWESKMERSFDHQMHNFWWQQDPWRNVGLSSVWSHPNESQDALNNEDKTRQNKPLPEVGAVKSDEQPEGNVQQMCPVEDLKASTATDEWQGANEHDHENDDQQKAGRVSPSAYQPEETWPRCEQKFVEREVLGVDDGIVDGIAWEVDDVHDGVDASECDNQPTSQLV